MKNENMPWSSPQIPRSPTSVILWCQCPCIWTCRVARRGKRTDCPVCDHSFGHKFAEHPAQDTGSFSRGGNERDRKCYRCNIRPITVLMPCVCQRQQQERGVSQHARSLVYRGVHREPESISTLIKSSPSALQSIEHYTQPVAHPSN